MMQRFLIPSLAAGLAIASLAISPATAQQSREQGEARKEMRAGNVLSLRQIERRVLPSMQGAE
ncbi:MAG: hypothetical protein KDD98_04140, partial [Sphingomonadaceae bacterium]|nr:hypothetical protein [Sphingomonadaceae bacterium]